MSRLRITAVTLTLSPRSASSMTFVPKLPDKLTIQSQQVCAQFDSDFWFWDKVTNHCSAAHLGALPKSQQKLIPSGSLRNFPKRAKSCRTGPYEQRLSVVDVLRINSDRFNLVPGTSNQTSWEAMRSTPQHVDSPRRTTMRSRLS